MTFEDNTESFLCWSIQINADIHKHAKRLKVNIESKGLSKSSVLGTAQKYLMDEERRKQLDFGLKVARGGFLVVQAFHHCFVSRRNFKRVEETDETRFRNTNRKRFT